MTSQSSRELESSSEHGKGSTIAGRGSVQPREKNLGGLLKMRREKEDCQTNELGKKKSEETSTSLA